MERGMFTILAASLLLLAPQVFQTKAMSVGFGEIDYQASEGNGGRYAVVQKVGENVGDLVLTVTTLRYDELDPTEVPDEIEDMPDAAEHDSEDKGRKDFYRVEETIVIPASLLLQDVQVFLPYYDDDINEETEGYFAMVRVNESASDPRDVAALDYIRNGVALMIINDNDEIRLSFEKESYVVPEENAVHKELVNIIKEDDGLTERTLQVLVQLNTLSGFDDAIRGEDFDIDSDVQLITFKPNEQNMYIPFSVMDDTIAEHREKFILGLSVPVNEGWRVGSIQSTDVFIEDNDVAIVGFENEEYTVKEEDGSVEVCVVLLSSNDIQLFVDGTIQITEGTAQAESDFTPINNIFFNIFNELTRACFVIPLVDDNEAEATETFTVTIDSLMPSNVIAQPNITTVIITDGDVSSDPPCECDVNAECLEESSTERKCVCNRGYTGDGRTCRDIDECTEGNDRCSSNAYCTNIPGSYRCQCKQGYSGNGVICRDINECSEGIHRCSTNGYCINLPGTYDCKCKWGFTGNGVICQDINECLTNSDRCSEYAYCRNNIGSYECHCKTGFTGNGIMCTDINECHTNQHECSEFAKCRNTIGSYICHCKRGYEGDGYICTPQDEENTKSHTKSRSRTHTHTHHSRTRTRNHKKTPGPHHRWIEDEQEDNSRSTHTHTRHTGTHKHSRSRTRSPTKHRQSHTRRGHRHSKTSKKGTKAHKKA